MNDPLYALKYSTLFWQVIEPLQKYGVVTAPPAPEYHGFIGGTVNATITLVHGMVNREAFLRANETTAEDWIQFAVATAMIHRAYYTGMVAAIEGMCCHYAKARQKTITCDQFLDRVNQAMGIAGLSGARRKHWRHRFLGLSVLRNIASHYGDEIATPKEIELLKRAKLEKNLSASGTFQTNLENYDEIAAWALEFIHEMEAACPLP